MAPVPAVNASLTPLVEYISPPPVGYAAPASVVVNIAPAPAVSCVASAPVDEYMAHALALDAAPAPVIIQCPGASRGRSTSTRREDNAPIASHVTPAPVDEYMAHVPAVNAARAPVGEFVAPAPVSGAAKRG